MPKKPVAKPKPGKARKAPAGKTSRTAKKSNAPAKGETWSKLKNRVKPSSRTPADKQQENSRGKRSADGKFLPGQSGNDGAKFKPGQSGNPKGRPKGMTPAEAYRAVLEAPSSKDPEKPLIQVVAENLGRTAEMGSLKAIRELNDRAFGKPRQTVENVNSSFDSARWLHIASRIASALEAFPEAREAVLKEFDAISAEDEKNAA